jgi:hypothetical protein
METMEQQKKHYYISDEMLNTINSDYATRDALSLIVNEVRAQEPIPLAISDDAMKEVLEEALDTIKKLDPDYRCIMYDNIAGFCNRGCPFGNNYGGKCGLRVMKSKLKFALGVED